MKVLKQANHHTVVYWNNWFMHGVPTNDANQLRALDDEKI